MPVGLFGKKLGMTQIFEESGTIFPVTILKTEMCQVSQIKTIDTDVMMRFRLHIRKKN